jgi:hypothetical protein
MRENMTIISEEKCFRKVPLKIITLATQINV